MAERNETGKQGEAEAQRYLEKNGYRILETNWRFHHYELDIIATNGEELIIIEVKTRSGNYLIAPEAAVDKGKIRRIVTASDAYVRMKKIDLPIRFDILCLIKNGPSLTVEDHIEDAFYAPLR
ncbi:YraN family protein [Bacteroides sp. OttesenSCG-928-D19]|nr:YraN family protein [Bacteroides sp. OttesenSCG-928-D19]